MHKAVFLDRDGVINVRPPEGLYITSVDELVILEGVAEAIAQLNASGFLVIVATKSTLYCARANDSGRGLEHSRKDAEAYRERRWTNPRCFRVSARLRR